MKRSLALLLALLALFSLAACGAPSSSAETAAAPTPDEIIVTPEAAPELPVASAEDVSLDGLKTLDEVYAYLDEVLPCPDGETLIPYVGDIYHAGDNTLTQLLYGLCTRSGRIVTKPVFNSVCVVRELLSDWPDPETLYLCLIYSRDTSPKLYTLDGTRADQRRYEGLPVPDGLVYGGVGDVVDDGFYYLDGYVLESGAALFPDHEGDRYEIRRKSDGALVAVTEMPAGCWPGLFSTDLGNGDRVYYTMLDGVCTTWDKDFTPIVRVPAAGVKTMTLFDDIPQEAQGELVSLSDAQLLAANLSLSNFSEQRFCEFLTFDHYDADDTSVAQLFSFAHLWAKINRQSAIRYINGYETMSLEDFLDIVSPRIVFPDDLRPVEGEDYSAQLGMGNFDWDHCWYEDGRFWYPAADGESFNRLSIVDEAFKINDWTYRFRFTIYELDLDIYWERGVPYEYYRLTPSAARQRAELSPVRTGTAVCTTVYWEREEREMFQLVSYELDR